MRRPFKSAFVVVAVSLFAPSAYGWVDGPLCAVQGPDANEEAFAHNAVCITPVARPSIPWTAPVTHEHARLALRRAEEALDEEKPGVALLNLRVVKHAMPELADRLALLEAEALTAMDEHRAACRAYAVATESVNRDVVIEGRVGAVRCLLAAGDRAGEEAFSSLLRRYPLLPEADELRLDLAQAREGWGSRHGAASMYRVVDLNSPGSHAATLAREGLARLVASGFKVRDLTAAERVQRAEALVRGGPVDDARNEVDALHADNSLTAELRARVLVMLARLARVEGRWDDARAAIAKASRQGVEVADAAKLLPPPAAKTDDSASRREGLAALAAVVRGRPWSKLTNLQLRASADIAGRFGLAESAGEVLGEMATRSTFFADALFDAAMRLAGLASDESIAAVLGKARDLRSSDAAIRYHYARALERLGRTADAEAEYRIAISKDHSETHYYRLWSEQRIAELRSESTLCCLPSSPTDSVLPPNPFDASGANTAGIAERLAPIVEAHGAAYPWLARARDLVVLGRTREAADELSETYLAWRDTVGSPRLRSGLEAVLTGSAPPRRAADWPLRKARLALDADTRNALADIAEELGDPGIAYRLGRGEQRLRPRAYSDLVERAAHRQGIDPNLLFGVMRVESIYNRRIVSTAGAVGLMQIMPRTGRLIADQLGVRDFDTADLLDPERNVEFSAWYLASLLRRFDGCLPLAIAAYNGGPHNVRLWMLQSHPNMPLDVFLERIPFSQTHRYVRRVLSHMAAYRAQQSLPMTRLAVELPESRPDPLAF